MGDVTYKMNLCPFIINNMQINRIPYNMVREELSALAKPWKFFLAENAINDLYKNDPKIITKT